jgi:hypothetical protein
MTSKIIELSQSNADVVNSNGDYEIYMPFSNDLIMKENDQLQLSKMFIDTEQASQQKLVISQDITLTMSFYKYYIYSRQDEVVVFNTGNIPDTDGQPYILCKEIGQTDLTEITQIKNGNVSGGISGSFTIHYTDSQSQKQTKTIKCNGSFIGLSFQKISLVYKNTEAITITNTDKDVISSIWASSPLPNSVHLEPILEKETLKILKGNYTPTQLSIEMNRQLQVGGISGETDKYATASNFLREYGGTTMFLVRQDGAEMVKLTGELLLGASQVELEYQTDTNQFSFNYLHMPYFINPSTAAPAQPAVGYIPNITTGTVSGDIYFNINKNSGIVFDNLVSVNADGSEPDFWSKTLGYDLTESGILVSYTMKTITYNGATLSVPHFDKDLEDGVSTTGGFFPLSAQLNRTSQTWYKPAIELDTQTGVFGGIPFLSTTTDTVNILGSQQTTSGEQFSTGFFLIGVNANFKTNYYSKDGQQNILGILSRYYELNSFTSGTSADSLVYTHVGEDITLSSFQIRIMSPNKKIAENLGENSAIFVEIISA